MPCKHPRVQISFTPQQKLNITQVCSYTPAFGGVTGKKKKNWKCVKTSQSEELSSPSCATIIICLSSEVMSSIMALEKNTFHE
jgi:hypothetical protein